MEHIEKAIQDWVGESEKVVEVDEIDFDFTDWLEYCHNDHFDEADGDEDWDSQVSDWNNDDAYAKEDGNVRGDLFIVFQSKDKPEEVILLRGIAHRKKDGELYYPDLDAWSIENAFGRGIWSDEAKAKMLRHEFYQRQPNDTIKFIRARIDY